MAQDHIEDTQVEIPVQQWRGAGRDADGIRQPFVTDLNERVDGALTTAHALSWATSGGVNYYQEPLALATSLWLIALDPLSTSDRPLAIDWSPECYQGERWDPEERLVSHYDVRERALDWAVYVSYQPARHAGCSIWTIVEPLLRLEHDTRARLALGQLSTTNDPGQPANAAAMLERNRVAGLLRSYFGASGDNGSAVRPGWSAG